MKDLVSYSHCSNLCAMCWKQTRGGRAELFSATLLFKHIPVYTDSKKIKTMMQAYLPLTTLW